MDFAFSQIDVFTEVPLRGNPLAVVHGADALAASEMQAFACWTQLSETAFLLRPTDPEADYRVRIFTPGGELPFAGHPTLGSCHAWLAAGGLPRSPGRVVQQCGVGQVVVRQGDGARLAFAAPPLVTEAVDRALVEAVCAALGLLPKHLRASRWLDNGPRWLGLQLESAEAVLALEPDHARLKSLAKVAVIGPHRPSGECDYEVRAFAAPIGIVEDPVTGSAHAGLAQWLIDRGEAPARYVAAQGSRIGRAGRVHVEHDGARLWIGGSSVGLVSGRVTLG